MPAALLAAAVTAEQFAAGLESGIDLRADAACFSTDYLTIPGDALFTVDVGQGIQSSHSNYDPSLSSIGRCDVAASPGSSGQHSNGPFGLGAAGVAWYRMPASMSMAPALVEDGHCGSISVGWLTGIPAGTQPPLGHSKDTMCADGFCADGSLPPPVGQAPAGGFVCFTNTRNTCDYVAVRAVACGPFAMWELPPAPVACNVAYCLDDVCRSTCAHTGACTADAYSAPGGCTCTKGWSGELCNE